MQTSTPFIIRKAEPVKDLENVQNLLQAYIFETYHDIGPTSETGQPRTELRETDQLEIQNPFKTVGKKGFIAIAEKRSTKKMLGMIMLQNNETTCCTIRRLYVPIQKRNGIGTMLMQYATEQAKTDGCTEMKLSVITQRPKIIQWYLRLGYKQGDTQIEDGVQLVQMLA